MNSPQENKYFEYRQIDSSYYDDVSLPMWLKNEMPDISSSILDYGCGFGQNIQALINTGYTSVHGADINAEALRVCREKGLHVGTVDPLHLKNPFEQKFDFVLMNHVLEHIPKDEIIKTLSFIRTELLKNGGRLLVSVPNAQSNTGCYWAYEDFTHTTLFTSGALYYVLKAAGFSVVSFLDIDCTSGNSLPTKLVKKAFLWVFRMNRSFWNKITSSSYHGPSTDIFSYEIKARAESS